MIATFYIVCLLCQSFPLLHKVVLFHFVIIKMFKKQIIERF